MGIFSKIKKNLEAAKEQERIYNEKTEAEKAKEAKRPEIKELNFIKMEPSNADRKELIDANCKKGNKKYKEQFLECIKAGKAEFAEAYGVVTLYKTVGHTKSFKDYMLKDDDYSGETINQCYVKIADTDGRVHKRMVAAMNYISLDYNLTVPELEADNPDIIDVNKYKHIFVMHYFLDKKEMYMALEDDEFVDLSKVIDHVYCDYDLFIDDMCTWNY